MATISEYTREMDGLEEAACGILGNGLPTELPIDGHATYAAGLKTAHGRKHGFWSLVKG